MPENDPNIGGNADILDSLSESLDNIDVSDVLSSGNGNEVVTEPSTEVNLAGSTLNENVFLDATEDTPHNTYKEKGDNIGSYLRRFFFSGVLSFIGIIVIVLAYSFNLYITQASQTTVDAKYQEYVGKYKDKLGKLKNLIGIDNTKNYNSPQVSTGLSHANDIINADDIDYIEKKDLLSNYVTDLLRGSEDSAKLSENLRQNIAKQGFFPQELELLLSEGETIDTIQRSLNALEIIKFSTATKVFSYMNTALVTILEMVKMNGVNVTTLTQLFDQINSRGEKDITAYVYMCYLNPFEISANCDTIGDLDLYYTIIEDKSINLKLFKNVMNAINQLLENEDTALFSITFKGFNAQAKSISFNIEVYTNQEDEKNLMAQGTKNPNIFILTNIINLLKQSSFIIGAEINTNEINVDTRSINWGGASRTVNYSSMDFDVPIQKDTEREIFDYIDVESIKKLLVDRGIVTSGGTVGLSSETKDNTINNDKGKDEISDNSYENEKAEGNNIEETEIN